MRISKVFRYIAGCSLILSSIIAYASESNEVVLKTHDFVVTSNDFDLYLKERSVNEQQREQMLSREGAVRNIFENIYVIKAFAAKGMRNSEIDMDEIQWMVDHHRDRLLMQRQIELEINEVLADIDWEPLAREQYIANRENFVQPDRLSADHILISIEDRSDEEAYERGMEVLSRIEKGENFGDLAREYSDDQGSRGKGGSLGYFSRGWMVEPFETAVFELEEGEISDLVKTDFGYHIIKLIERQPEQQQSFDQVKEQLIAEVKNRRQEQVRAQKISEIRSGAIELGLEVNVEKLEAIEAQYAPAEDSTTSAAQ